MKTPKPTPHGPGSTEKIIVLEKRYEAGEAMWHEDDNPQCSREPLGIFYGWKSSEQFEADDDEGEEE